MVTSSDCMKKYGFPSYKSKWIQMLNIPEHLQLEHLPKKIYCNYDFHSPFLKALTNIKEAGVDKEIKTFDGCFNIRKMRNASAWSLHSWAVAVDLNAFENQMYTSGQWSQKFIDCFIEAGFDYGGYWKKRTDPMHFQLANIL